MSDFPMPRPAVAYEATTDTDYPNAAVRGQVRLWKQKLAEHYRHFERGYLDPQTVSIKDAFVHKTGAGRRRAFNKLSQAFGPGLTLEGLRDGKTPLAVWSILKPRDSLKEHDDRNCVSVNYVLCGVLPSQTGRLLSGAAEGVWSLEIFDHALGRILERMGMTTPLEAVIAEAHHNVLRLNLATVLPGNDFNRTPKFYVRAGNGAFMCKVATGLDKSVGLEPMFYIQAVTWIADDMVHDDQALLVADGNPGERLVDSWLLPRPVRRIVRKDNKIECYSWIAGLPDLLAMPQGRA